MRARQRHTYTRVYMYTMPIYSVYLCERSKNTLQFAYSCNSNYVFGRNTRTKNRDRTKRASKRASKQTNESFVYKQWCALLLDGSNWILNDSLCLCSAYVTFVRIVEALELECWSWCMVSWCEFERGEKHMTYLNSILGNSRKKKKERRQKYIPDLDAHAWNCFWRKFK